MVDDLISYMAVGLVRLKINVTPFVASERVSQQDLKIQHQEISMWCSTVFMQRKINKFHFLGKEVETQEPLSHAILRGALNEYGKNIRTITTII